MRTKPAFAAYICVFLAVIVLFSASMVQAAEQNRIVGRVDDTQMAAVRGNVHYLAQPRFDQGRVDAGMQMSRVTLMFSLSQAQQADLDTLLREQQDPASTNYHNWLTPEQYGMRFGLSDADLRKTSSWLQAHGLTIDEVARGRNYISFSGPAAQVESAFRTEIHRYMVDGEEHFANATDPSVPAAFANVVVGVDGLHNFRLKSRVVVRPRPAFTSSVSGNHFLAPDDVATIYNLKPLYTAGIDGTGQSIAVVGQTDITMSDITTFRSLSGLPANNPTVILVPGDSGGFFSSDIAEADLDLEWSGAIAKNASVIYVNSPQIGAFNALRYAINNNVAPVISVSYGNCEANFSNTSLTSLSNLAQQGNTQGITILAASADTGAADCDGGSVATHGLAVDVPASFPAVTGVGGTEFNEGTTPSTFWSSTNNGSNGSALSYIPETAWNDTATDNSLTASGGGASGSFVKPVWQVGPGVPNDSARDVPDVALTASGDHDGYLICSPNHCVSGFRDSAGGNLDVVGGTSASAPVFAGITALINQKVGSSQGNINPRLYQMAAAGSNAFHDITVGDNKVPCQTGSTGCPNGGLIGFSAGPGYDQVTGLGSVDARNLVNGFAVANNAVPTISSLSPSTAVAGSAGFTLTVNGTGFVSSSVIQWNATNRTTTFVSATQLTTLISAADIATSGTPAVTVFSPAPGGGTSTAVNFTVTASGNNPVPVLTSLSPGTATAGGAAFSMILTGSGFGNSSVVQWNGSARTTTFNAATQQLTAQITAADIATVGTSTVTVFNPAPGGGTSGSVSFFVTAAGTFPFGTSATNIRYWPHIVTGIGYVTKMTITNLTNAQNNVIVYFVSQSGTTSKTNSYSLPAAGTVRFATDESARFAAPTTQWAIVNSQGAVAINLFFEVILSPGGTVANTVGFNDSPPLTDFTMPVEFQPASSGFRTVGIACSNINTSAVIISMELIDQGGNIIASSNLNPVSPPSTGPLAAFGQTTVDLQSIFGSALPAGNFVGSLTVHAAFASGGAAASVSCLGLEDDLGLFSATPPIPGRAK